MKRTIFTLFFLVMSHCLVAQLSCDASQAFCFDKMQTFSLRQLQEIDMLATFEAVYESAHSEGREAELTQGFINCLEILRSGDDRVNCSDFIASIKILFEFLMTVRSADSERRSNTQSRWLQSDLEAFAQDVVEEFWDLWRRVDILEEHCGVLNRS
jgi:hypothetical protein